jgi:putative spermidine/putrescine transport system ATP-binding protein
VVDLAVQADAITKRFEQAVAVDGLTLEVKRGEFLSFLGPSGCGKTTTLRMIAGFVEPDEGTISIMGKDMTDSPPHKRNLGMVFQNYALFPHMTVFDNVAFGLKMRKFGAAERKRRVEQALELVQLSALQRRYPRQLSGGQQQRVALARAIVIEPYVLLLDEPLSNLDAKLRKAMQTELRDLQQRLGITAIYVTHDQEEAMTVSDRIVVMNQGKIMQIGAPAEVYRRPANEFVAGFIGQVNFVRGTMQRVSGGWSFTGELGLTVHVADDAVHPRARDAGVPVELAIRPESIRLCSSSPSATEDAFGGVVTRAVYTGASTTYQVSLDGGENLQALDQDRPDAQRWGDGDRVSVVLALKTLYVVPAGGQR